MDNSIVPTPKKIRRFKQPGELDTKHLAERLKMLIEETSKLSEELQPFIELEEEFPGIRVLKESSEEIRNTPPKIQPRGKKNKVPTYSLAEILEIRGIELTEEQMARLAYSVSGTFRALKHKTPLKENRPTSDGKWVARRNVYLEEDFPIVDTCLAELRL